jgi:hypothetical protein
MYARVVAFRNLTRRQHVLDSHLTKMTHGPFIPNDHLCSATLESAPSFHVLIYAQNALGSPLTRWTVQKVITECTKSQTRKNENAQITNTTRLPLS